MSQFGHMLTAQYPQAENAFGEDVVYTHRGVSVTLTGIVDETQNDVSEAQAYENRLRRAKVSFLGSNLQDVETERDTVTMRGETWLVVNVRDLGGGAIKQIDCEVRETM